MCSGPRWCPEEDAGFLSTAFFYYVNSLMALGYQKHLEADDLWTLCRRDKAQVVVDTFQRLMESTMKPVTSPQVSHVMPGCIRRGRGSMFSF